MKKVSNKAWIIVLILVLIFINTFRITGNLDIFTKYYTGMALAILGIILAGLISNRLVGAMAGGLIMGFGILLRIVAPLIPSNLKDDKLVSFLAYLESYENLLKAYWLIFLVLGIFIGYISGLAGEALFQDRSKKFTTVKISYMAIFIALSVMINSLRIGSISFGGFPIILSGYLMGPIPGFIVGGVADILAFMVRPSAFPFNPLFTLTSALTGAIPIMVSTLLGHKKGDYNLFRVLIGVFVGQMLTSVILVPIFSVWLYGRNTFWVIAGKAFIKQILSIPIYAVLITIIGERLEKVVDFKKEFN